MNFLTKTIFKWIANFLKFTNLPKLHKVQQVQRLSLSILSMVSKRWQKEPTMVRTMQQRRTAKSKVDNNNENYAKKKTFIAGSTFICRSELLVLVLLYSIAA